MTSRPNTIAIVLTTIGTLLFIMSGFQILPWKYTVFAAIACYILAGMSRRITKQREE